MVWPTRMEGHHAFTVHQLLHGQLIGLLRSSPFCSPVLKPYLQEGEKGKFNKAVNVYIFLILLANG